MTLKNLKKRRIFIDMDGVLVDFDRFCLENNITPDMAKSHPKAYFDMLPMPDAISSVKEIIRMGFEVFIATKPPTGVADSYADKAAWIFHYLPELKRHLIITPDKGLLGDKDDVLIDDRIHKANCENFSGLLIHFGSPHNWGDVLKILENLSPDIIDQEKKNETKSFSAPL